MHCAVNNATPALHFASYGLIFIVFRFQIVQPLHRHVPDVLFGREQCAAVHAGQDGPGGSAHPLRPPRPLLSRRQVQQTADHYQEAVRALAYPAAGTDVLNNCVVLAFDENFAIMRNWRES